MSLGSGLGSLVRLQLGCWPGQPSPMGLEGDPRLRRLIHMTGELALALGGRPQFFFMRVA